MSQSAFDKRLGEPKGLANFNLEKDFLHNWRFSTYSNNYYSHSIVAGGLLETS